MAHIFIAMSEGWDLDNVSTAIEICGGVTEVTMM
jgi:hypothetical protein